LSAAELGAKSEAEALPGAETKDRIVTWNRN
jgi:hypothetical protein